MDEREYYEEEEEYQQKEPDQYFIDAQADIRLLFENNKDSVFYLRQLQVKFEKKYFHWVTNNALEGLVKIGYLKNIRIDKQEGTSTRYFIHKSNRYPKRSVQKIEEVVNEYSQDHITRSCGHRAEDLFCKALALHGFMPIAMKVNEYKGIKWTKTGHDLDYIFVKDEIEYGCEIKNTLGYIDKDELDLKLEMCSFLKIKPLFIMRYAPKTYNKKIIDEYGGYALLFKTQIYELSQEDLVNRIIETTGLPVICTSGIPDGFIDKLKNWHNKHVK